MVMNAFRDDSSSSNENDYYADDHSSEGVLHNDFRLYHMLGLEVDATLEEINRAFKKVAMASHPDRGGDSDKVSKNVNLKFVL